MTRVFGDCHGRLGRDNVEILTSEWEIHGNPTVQPHPLHNFDRSLGPRWEAHGMLWMRVKNCGAQQRCANTASQESLLSLPPLPV